MLPTDPEGSSRRLRLSPEKTLSAPKRASRQNYKVFATSPQRILAVERPSSQEESKPAFQQMKRSGSPVRRQKINEYEQAKKRANESEVDETKKPLKKVTFDTEDILEKSIVKRLEEIEAQLKSVILANDILVAQVDVLNSKVAALETTNENLQKQLDSVGRQ